MVEVREWSCDVLEVSFSISSSEATATVLATRRVHGYFFFSWR